AARRALLPAPGGPRAGADRRRHDGLRPHSLLLGADVLRPARPRGPPLRSVPLAPDRRIGRRTIARGGGDRLARALRRRDPRRARRDRDDLHDLVEPPRSSETTIPP